MSLVLSERGVALWHADHLALAEVASAAGGVDAVIVDAPYSAAVHAGHGTMERHGTATPPAYDGAARREIDYAAWTADDVRAFVAAWLPLTRGWFVSITDDTLAPAWKRAYQAEGLTAFASLPFYSPGSRVRLAGDGPSPWTTWIMVARPKALSRWGTLPGGYTGATERAMPIVGGKPEWLMRALVRDYTRENDLVCDPCCGAGTLGVACIAEGRRALLGDSDAAHVAIAAERLRALPHEPKRGTLALPWGTT